MSAVSIILWSFYGLGVVLTVSAIICRMLEIKEE